MYSPASCRLHRRRRRPSAARSRTIAIMLNVARVRAAFARYHRGDLRRGIPAPSGSMRRRIMGPWKFSGVTEI